MENQNLKKSVEDISRGFMIVGKSRVKWVYAYLVIALVLGVGVGIGYVIGGNGSFFGGQAAPPIPDPGVPLGGGGPALDCPPTDPDCDDYDLSDPLVDDYNPYVNDPPEICIDPETGKCIPDQPCTEEGGVCELISTRVFSTADGGTIVGAACICSDQDGTLLTVSKNPTLTGAGSSGGNPGGGGGSTSGSKKACTGEGEEELDSPINEQTVTVYASLDNLIEGSSVLAHILSTESLTVDVSGVESPEDDPHTPATISFDGGSIYTMIGSSDAARLARDAIAAYITNSDPDSEGLVNEDLARLGSEIATMFTSDIDELDDPQPGAGQTIDQIACEGVEEPSAPTVPDNCDDAPPKKCVPEAEEVKLTCVALGLSDPDKDPADMVTTVTDSKGKTKTVVAVDVEIGWEVTPIPVKYTCVEEGAEG